jgi:hypothetical protein
MNDELGVMNDELGVMNDELGVAIAKRCGEGFE